MVAATSLLTAGDVIAGFEVEDLIGIGGMATVYRARQVSLGRSVALKVLAPQFTGDEVFRERFRREGMHAASLEHPNIVPVYDSGEQEGLLYLAMRLVDGPSLAELLTAPGLTADRTIEILRPIASALDCAHAAGLIHRDVKPQNILITNQGHPYLADFGVAKAANAPGLTRTGGFVGSVNYASPEQIKGLTLTASSDIYALTAVLYHCLSGDVPYPGVSEAGVMHAHLHEPPPTLPALEGAGSDFHTVFARGMAKDPGARYGHAGDLLNAAALCVSRLPSAERKATPAFPGRARDEGPSPGGPAAGEAEAVDAAAGVGADSLTAADRRREPAPEPPAGPARARRLHLPARPRLPELTGAWPRLRLPQVPRPRISSGPRPARRWLAAAAAVAAVVLVAAFALGAFGGGGASANSVRKGPVELSYRPPWRIGARPADAPAYGLRFRSPIALRSARGALLAGRLDNGAPVPGGIPPALAARLDRKPSRQVVSLGAVQAVRYASTAEQGAAAVAVYVIPTASGDIGVLCSEASPGGSGESCATTAETLKILGAHPVPPGADSVLAAGLNAALRPVATARGHTSDPMVSQPAPRVRAARRVAAGDARAAKRIAGLPVESRDRAAVGALTTSLRLEAQALGMAAAAARAGDYSKSVRAARSVRSAGRAVAKATAAMRRIGFGLLPLLRPLDVPALPRPRPRSQEGSEAPASGVPVGSPSPGAPEPEPEPEPAAPAPAPAPEPAAPSGGSSGHAVVSAPK